MDLAQRIKAHFQALPVGKVEVPEWGEDGQPLVIYYRAPTVEERQKFVWARERDGEVAASATVIVTKALDADGKKLFTIEHKRLFLKEADATVVLRIAHRMLLVPSVEEMGKDSERTPDSD